MTKTFVCEICKTPLGKVNLDELSVPMQPEMFHSVNPERGIPVPFREFQEFLTFRCRQCKRRPFKEPDHITCLNDKGFRVRYNINKLGIEQKTREANQAKINEIFGKDTVERPTPVSKFQEPVVNLFKKKREPEGFNCPQCGKTYKHRSSLARHKGKCNA